MSRRRHEEDGVALIAAICSLALMITLGGIALNQAVGALRNTTHQTNVKRAEQAADAAIDAAAFRLSRLDVEAALKIDPLNPGQVLTQNCIVSVAGVAGVDVQRLDPTTPPDADGLSWCPESLPEETADGARFTYRVSQLLRVGSGTCGSDGALSLTRYVVGVGTSAGVTRRTKVKLEAPLALLSGAAVQSAADDLPLTMSGTATVAGDVRTNASITADGVNVISGSAVVGANGTVTGVVPAGAKGTSCVPFDLPEVNQGTAPTVNDNGLIYADCVDPLALVAVGCRSLLGATNGGVEYDPVKRTLRVFGTGRVTLTGSTYSFCSIRLEGNGILQVKNSTAVTRIFLDDPANCGGVPNAGGMNVDGQARILNCHSQLAPETLQLYAVGNPGVPSTVTFAAGALLTGLARSTACGLNLPVAGEPMTLYAPHSTIDLGGTTAIAGQVAGDVVHLSGAARVNPVNALVNLDQLGGRPTLALYVPRDYVQCTGLAFAKLPAANPAQGC